MRRTFTAIILTALAVGLANPGPASAAVTKSTLQTLAARLEANARLELEGKPIDPTTEAALKNVVYDDLSLGFLKEVLAEKREAPVHIYVAERLIWPLVNHPVSIIRQGLPIAEAYKSKFAEFKDLPRYSKEQLALLTVDERLKDNKAAYERARQRAEAARAEKRQKEREVMLHNKMAHRMHQTVTALRIRSNQKSADEKLLADLKQYEEEGSYLFVELLQDMRAEANYMPKPRAELYYDELSKLALKLKTKRAHYAHPSKADLADTGNSRFESKRVYPGIRLLEAVNRVAVPARKPALKVPRQRDIDKWHRRRGRRR